MNLAVEIYQRIYPNVEVIVNEYLSAEDVQSYNLLLDRLHEEDETSWKGTGGEKPHQ